MKKSESQILADVYEKVRNLSKMFIKSIDQIDIHKQLEINGVKFNSAYWLIAHLAWTEHSLIVYGVGGQDMKLEWLEEYGFGTDPENVITKPPLEDVLKQLDDINAKAMEIIKGLSDEQLEEDNHLDFTIAGSKSKRNLIIHSIRHEPMHIGQLSWILKSNGIKFA